MLGLRISYAGYYCRLSRHMTAEHLFLFKRRMSLSRISDKIPSSFVQVLYSHYTAHFNHIRSLSFPFLRLLYPLNLIPLSYILHSKVSINFMQSPSSSRLFSSVLFSPISVKYNISYISINIDPTSLPPQANSL